MTTPRRIGNLIKCRGMLVNTEIIHGVLAAIEGVGEFQIVFMRGPKNGGMDHLVIRLERVAGAKNALTSTMIRRVDTAFFGRPKIEFVSRETSMTTSAASN
jgi:phenylacetate-coenzyme A ligase PaaK-like adenylate-forming protein